jgi:hypothetical protein
MGEVFGCIRSANVALRWLLLHTGALHRRLRVAVASAAPPPDALLALLLDTALLEFEVSSAAAACLLLHAHGMPKEASSCVLSCSALVELQNLVR